MQENTHKTRILKPFFPGAPVGLQRIVVFQIVATGFSILLLEAVVGL